MIFDTNSHLPQYLPSEVWKELKPVIHRLNSDMPEGKCWIREPEIYAEVSSYKTRSAHEARLETHKRYVDIQIMLTGSEKMEVTPPDALIPDTDYDEEKDIRFYKRIETPAVRLLMEPGNFAMFFPQDAHCPQLTPNSEAQNVKKMVIKIDARLFAKATE
jgi:YhcH/YjgK/YiaL family protein